MYDIRLEVARLLFASPGGSNDGYTNGAVWTAMIPSVSGSEYKGKVLILDYNPGNEMAITVVVDNSERPHSRIAIPIGFGSPRVNRQRWRIKYGLYSYLIG